MSDTPEIVIKADRFERIGRAPMQRVECTDCGSLGIFESAHRAFECRRKHAAAHYFDDITLCDGCDTVILNDDDLEINDEDEKLCLACFAADEESNAADD